MEKIKNIEYKDGLSLSYTEYGKATAYPILVFHGLIGSIKESFLPKELDAKNLRFICIARPGYGDSDFFKSNNYLQSLEYMNTLLKVLKIDKFSVIGISAGAPYAYALGKLFKDRLEKIFIYSGIPFLHEANILSFYKNKEEVKKEYEFYKNSSLEDIAKHMHKIYVSTLPSEYLDNIHIQDSIQNNCIPMAQEAKLQASDWNFTSKDITQDITVYHSSDDEEISFEAAFQSSKLLCSCKFKKLQNQGHYDPKGFFEFLERVVKTFN